MSNDRRQRPQGSERLWTDPRTTEEHQHWLAPPPPPVRRVLPTDPPPEPPGPSPDALRRRRRLLVAIVATMALVGIGLGAAGQSLLGGNDVRSKTEINVSTGGAPAGEKARTVRAIYAAASPSVVFIRVDRGGSSASGTGFLIADDGTIVTNAHVVEGATTAKVRLGDHGRDYTAQIVGRDPSSDLAVIKVPSSATNGIKPLTLADSGKVKVGDLAVAIGYPLGLDRTATSGIVSGVGREIQAPNGFQIDEAIQTDAPINPGNSGGPLLDSTGRVIGVNSQIATAGGGGSVGIGFAVASNTLRDVVPKLTRGETINRAYLGVSTGAQSGNTGAIVGSVVPSGPGDAAGLRAGDVIRSVGGKTVNEPDDVGMAVGEHKPGDRIDVQVERNGSTVTVPVTLGTRPAQVP
jgi:putative serine protease PepD